METQLHKEVYYQDDTVIFEYEMIRDALIIHCKVSKWSPTILRKFYSVFNEFKDDAVKNGIYKILTFTPNPKFCKLFCGVKVNSFIYEGIEHETILWELKPLQ